MVNFIKMFILIVIRIVTYLLIFIGILVIKLATFEFNKNNIVTVKKIKRIRYFYNLKRSLLLKYPSALKYLGLYNWFKNCVN